MIHTVCKVIPHCKSRHTQPSWKWIKSTLWTRGQELTRDCLILFLLFSDYSLSWLLYSPPILSSTGEQDGSIGKSSSLVQFVNKNWVDLSHLCMQAFLQIPTLIFNSRSCFPFQYPFLFPDCPLAHLVASSPPSFWPVKFCLVTTFLYGIVNTSHVRLTWFC